MNFDGPNSSDVKCDINIPRLAINSEEAQSVRNVPKRHKKKKAYLSSMRTAAIRQERKRSYELLERVLCAKQQTLNDQQCEIDYMKKKMTTLIEDNRFLKEQSHMQAAVIDRLDGKNAKMPGILNSQLEEIRVYREQLKRLKDIFVQTNKAHQDTDNARRKAEEELQHLRSLAFEKNLPEREELIAAVEHLKVDLQSVEKDKIALEKYVANLEKNQKHERVRLLKTQKELQVNCTSLSKAVRDLQMNLYEKQKMLDVQAMHLNRANGRGEHRSVATATDARLATLAPAQSLEPVDDSTPKPEEKKVPVPPPHLPKIIIPESNRTEISGNEATPESTTALASSRLKTIVEKSETSAYSVPTTPESLPKKASSGETRYRPGTMLNYISRSKSIDTIYSAYRPRTTCGTVVIPSAVDLRNRTRQLPFQGQCERRGHSLDSVASAEDALATLQANEKIARLVAQAKLLEATTTPSQSRPRMLVSAADAATESSTPKRVPSVVGAQTCDDWPEFEVVEPLKTQALPKPIEVKNNLNGKQVKPSSAGSVAAGGDAPEVTTILRKIPDRQTRIQACAAHHLVPSLKSSSAISNLVRDVCSVEAGLDCMDDESMPSDGRFGGLGGAFPSPDDSEHPRSHHRSRDSCDGSTDSSEPKTKMSSLKHAEHKGTEAMATRTLGKPKTITDGHAKMSGKPLTGVIRCSSDNRRTPQKIKVKILKTTTPQSVSSDILQQDHGDMLAVTEGTCQVGPGLGTRLASTLFSSHLHPLSSANKGSDKVAKHAKTTSTRTTAKSHAHQTIDVGPIYPPC